MVRPAKLPHPLTISPSHHLTISSSHHLTIYLPARIVLTFSPIAFSSVVFDVQRENCWPIVGGRAAEVRRVTISVLPDSATRTQEITTIVTSYVSALNEPCARPQSM